MTLHAAQRAVERKKLNPQKRARRYREEAAERQGWRCYWCGDLMTPPDPSGAKQIGSTCTADHVTARADGGGTTRVNIVAACAKCNSSRPNATRAENDLKQNIRINGTFRNHALAVRFIETFGLETIMATLRAAHKPSGGADA